MKILPDKDYREIVPVTFDFTADVATGATVALVSVTVSVVSGTDASPSALLNGAATASGAMVTQWIDSGVVGVTYKLVCEVTASDGQTLVLSARVTVVGL